MNYLAVLEMGQQPLTRRGCIMFAIFNKRCELTEEHNVKYIKKETILVSVIISSIVDKLGRTLN